jgi:tetratricopeptide (TPR) repeat protein
MYKQLQKLYFDQFLNNPNHANNRFVVYRGQSMKITEFDQIKDNIGRLISVNVFLSTTKRNEMAVIYSGSNPNQQEPNLLTLIFEIEIDLTHNATKRPYASLKHLSQFPEEDEILLSIGSTFRIIDVEDRRTSDGHWYVKMIIVEYDDDVNELRNDLEKEYSITGNLCDFGHVLIGMCDYDRAERYYRMLLEYLPEDHSSFGHIQTALGVIFANRGDYQTALQFQEQALKFYTSGDPLHQSKDEISKVYVHMGAAYRHLGKLDLTLKYCSMAADMQSPTGSLAFTYNEIALTHRAKGDNRLALEYFLKSLHIDERIFKLSKYHPKLATAYNNIGEIYIQLNDFENALKYLQYALDIHLKGTVSTHTDLAAIYHNLGHVYQKEGELKKALEMHEKALEIDIRILNEDHESITSSHFAIAKVHAQLNDLANALYHAEKGLRILLRSQSKDNRSLVAQYQVNLGWIQYQLGNTTKALKIAEKALNNALACSPESQKDIAYIYDLFSHIYEKEGDISKALDYTKKAIEQAKAWAMRNHTFELEYFLTRLDSVKNKSVNEDSKFSTSLTETKILLDKANIRDRMLLETSEELEQTPKDNVQQRLDLISSLITMYSRQKNFSMAKKYFDQANTIYAEYQSSDIITKDQLENAMITIFYHTALSYHRQQDWSMCLNMLTKSLNIILQHNKEHILLPEIYYMMASCYMHRKEIPTAHHYYQLTISTAGKILPDDHPDMQRYRFQFQLFTKALSEAHF